MTRTEELLKLAEAAKAPEYEQTDLGTRVNFNASIARLRFHAAANPETIKQLVELVRLQHEALKVAADKVYSEHGDDEIGQAIAAFEKFERGEK